MTLIIYEKLFSFTSIKASSVVFVTTISAIPVLLVSVAVALSLAQLLAALVSVAKGSNEFGLSKGAELPVHAVLLKVLSIFDVVCIVKMALAPDAKGTAVKLHSTYPPSLPESGKCVQSQPAPVPKNVSFISKSSITCTGLAAWGPRFVTVMVDVTTPPAATRLGVLDFVKLKSA